MREAASARQRSRGARADSPVAFGRPRPDVRALSSTMGRSFRIDRRSVSLKKSDADE